MAHNLRPRRNNRRSVVTLLFLIFALPMVFFAAAISVDYGKILTSKSQSQTLADAAATAAANQLKPTDLSGGYLQQTAEIDATTAALAAENLVCEAINAGMGRTSFASDSDCREMLNLEFFPSLSEATSVKATLAFTTNDLSFLGVLGFWYSNGGGEKDSVSFRSLSGASTAQAFVCLPGSDNPTEGRCVRPRA